MKYVLPEAIAVLSVLLPYSTARTDIGRHK